MDDRVLDRFRRALVSRRDRLAKWQSSSSAERDRCLGPCDESEVCIVEELDEAIRATIAGDFGRCCKCDGEVEEDRLRLDFTTRICLDHYSAEELKQLERDLELAAEVQRKLFPKYVPAIASLEIAAHVKPARTVGGDYYDFFPFEDQRQGIIVADVMGKGLAARMLMSQLQASTRILGPQYSTPHQMASRLNEIFRYNIAVTQFMSVFLASVDAASRQIHYCSAGHPPALLYSAADQSVQWLPPTGPAVGLVHSPGFSTRSVLLESGDVMLVYTDGVAEARNAQRVEYGLERVEAVVRGNADLSAPSIVEAIRVDVDAFTEDVAHDDVTVVALKGR